MGATRHPQTIPREIMKLASIATLMGGASAFVDVDKTSISIPEVGKDLFVSCEGTRMEAKMTKDYISKNTQWLGNGDYIVMGVMDMTSDWEDCKGKRDADGNVILSITDDFTKCGTRVEQVTDSSIDENGIETQVVTEYKFINHIVNDEVGDGFSIVNRTLDLVEFTCSYPTVQMTTGEINPLIQSALEKSKTKEIKGDMRLYKSNNYTDFYTEPPVLGLEEVLYVEVNLERPLVSDDFAASTDFAVVMEHCWGTPHDSRNGDIVDAVLAHDIEDLCRFVFAGSNKQSSVLAQLHILDSIFVALHLAFRSTDTVLINLNVSPVESLDKTLLITGNDDVVHVAPEHSGTHLHDITELPLFHDILSVFRFSVFGFVNSLVNNQNFIVG